MMPVPLWFFKTHQNQPPVAFGFNRNHIAGVNMRFLFWPWPG
jgi:hypothetical protein